MMVVWETLYHRLLMNPDGFQMSRLMLTTLICSTIQHRAIQRHAIHRSITVELFTAAQSIAMLTQSNPIKVQYIFKPLQNNPAHRSEMHHSVI